MAAQGYPPQPGMGPGHPGMAHAHPAMQMQHGAHMGQPNPAMMAGMHPTMSNPQVTQGMATGMPQNPGTPAPMQNPMAMAHLQQGNPNFQGQQHNLGQMSQMNANLIARQRQLSMMQHGNPNHAMMNMQGLAGMNPAQLQQMKMGVPMQMGQMTPQQQQHVAQQQQTYLHQQRMMAQHAQQQQILSHQRAQAQAHQQQQQQQAQQQAAQQQQASQQMQMSRSQEPVTQPPQSQPTPAPQAQPTPQSQPQPNPTPHQTPQQKQAQTQPATTQAQQNNANTPQIKQHDDDEAQAKELASKQQILMEDMAMAQAQQFSGQCILQLMSYYDSLACPQRPYDIDHWQETTAKYFSPSGQMRLQLFNIKSMSDKSFLLRYASIARFFHAHFTYGISKIYMQSFEHSQETLPHGGFHVWSRRMFLTYEYEDGVRICAQGHLSVNFDEMQKIEFMHIAIKGWTEYVPRTILEPVSPEQNRQSPKMSKKNLPKNQNRPQLKRSPVLEWGIPKHLMQFLEVSCSYLHTDPLLTFFVDRRSHDRNGPTSGIFLLTSSAESKRSVE